jgi:hypothetical protein
MQLNYTQPFAACVIGPPMVAARTPVPGADLLNGAEEIAEFMFGDQRYRSRVYYLARKGVLPIFRLGSRLYARKSVLSALIEGAR